MSFRFQVCPAILAVLLATAVAASAQQDAFCICLDPLNPDSCGGNVEIPVGEPTNIYCACSTPAAAWCFVGRPESPIPGMTVRIQDDGAPVRFFVGPIPGSASFPQGVPGYVHTLGFNTPATVCSGDFGEPVFSINGAVATDRDTWGAIKSVYSGGPASGR
jgi:hypothetical protein